MRPSSAKTCPSRERKCSYNLPERFRWGAYLSVIGALALVFSYLAVAYVRRYSLGFTAASAIYLSFVFLIALALAPGFDVCLPGAGFSSAARAGTRPPAKKILLFSVVSLIPYLLYALGTGDFHFIALARLIAVSALCLAIYALFPVPSQSSFWAQDLAVAAGLIYVVLGGQLKDIWNVPVNLDFMGRLFLIATAAWAWRYVRPLPRLGFDLRLTRPILTQAALNFALFAALALPLSLGLHFTKWNPQWHGLLSFLASYLEIFLFVALLEELFFRAFLQTLLAGALRAELLAQAIVSVLFGFFHILHAPFPNWRYVGLATLAGWFYGTAFRKTGNITTSALVHAAVDAVWRTWLSA